MKMIYPKISEVKAMSILDLSEFDYIVQIDLVGDYYLVEYIPEYNIEAFLDLKKETAKYDPVKFKTIEEAMSKSVKFKEDASLILTTDPFGNVYSGKRLVEAFNDKNWRINAIENLKNTYIKNKLLEMQDMMVEGF